MTFAHSKPSGIPAALLPERPIRLDVPVRLVALDLDGTLLTSRKTVTRRTHLVLRKILDQGVHLVFATARPPRSVRPYYDALKLQTPTVNYNGALIWHEPTRRVVRHSPLPASKARQVIAHARKLYPEILVSVEILDKWYTDHYADLPEYATETSKHFMPDFVGPVEAFLTVPATKVMLLGDPTWIADLERKLPAKFGDSIEHTRSDPHLLQVMHPGVNKGVALASVAAQLGVARREVMAIGDAPNDIAMLDYAGLAVAPENAWPVIKPRVHAVVASNDDDGVAEALERFVLKR